MADSRSLSERLSKLPPGRHLIPRDFVSQNQRERMLPATAELVAERIPDGATIQAGIGAVPDQVLALLADHRDLGVHTELLSSGFVDLVEKGAVTERAVLAAAKAGERLVLGPRAVLTPLARDKARALGVRVEKER